MAALGAGSPRQGSLAHEAPLGLGRGSLVSLFGEGRGSGQRLRLGSLGPCGRKAAGIELGREACRIGGPREARIDQPRRPRGRRCLYHGGGRGKYSAGRPGRPGNSPLFRRRGSRLLPSVDVLHRGRGAIQWSSDAPTQGFHGNRPSPPPSRELGGSRGAYGHKAFRRPRDGEPP